jgi:hypothetical protein
MAAHYPWSYDSGRQVLIRPTYRLGGRRHGLARREAESGKKRAHDRGHARAAHRDSPCRRYGRLQYIKPPYPLASRSPRQPYGEVWRVRSRAVFGTGQMRECALATVGVERHGPAACGGRSRLSREAQDQQRDAEPGHCRSVASPLGGAARRAQVRSLLGQSRRRGLARSQARRPAGAVPATPSLQGPVLRARPSGRRSVSSAAKAQAAPNARIPLGKRDPRSASDRTRTGDLRRDRPKVAKWIGPRFWLYQRVALR